MNIKRINLSRNEDKEGRGFEMQGLQKSKVFQGKNIEDIVIQSISPRKDRGGHYHERKTEWFLALSGKAELIWTDKLNPEKTDLHIELFDADLNTPYVLEVPPFVVHWVKNNTNEVFLMASFSTEEYNPSNPDTCRVMLHDK